jgi:hypothetical protein
MSWADSEFEDAWFGDDRLRQRAIRVCERLAGFCRISGQLAESAASG